MHYINTGNIFSRSLFIQEHLATSLIVTKDENLKKLSKILGFLQSPGTEITCISQLIDCAKNTNGNFIVSYDLFFANIPNNWQLENKYTLQLSKNNSYNIDELIKQLSDFGYIFREYLEGGDYKKNGDTLFIKLKDKTETIIISFWGDGIENIFIEDNTHRTEVNTIFIGKMEPIHFFNGQDIFQKELLSFFDNKSLILDNVDIQEGFSHFHEQKNIISLDILKNTHLKQINNEISDIFIDNLEMLIKTLKQDKTISIYTKNDKTIASFVKYNGLENITVIKTELNILKSFQSPTKIILCDDILSKIFIKKRVKKSLSENIDLLLHIKPGDYVVHIDHGIGVFNGIIKKHLPSIKGEISREYLEISYKNNDKLFVPITEVRRVSKYIGHENPNLTGLSTKEWSKKLEKISEDVQKTAEELLALYAQRQILQGFAFQPYTHEMGIFQKSFDYDYTLDQLNAIDEILSDMQKETPMERILVGDVGFGKTEVAFNAIYNAFLNKKQAVLISPLIVLAYEHYNKACERFSEFPIQIELLTRFQSNSEVKIILDKLKNGKIDLIIGTHRLLGESLQYKNLGLLVIDEEHKFGVKDKEKIKELKGNIDILSMSATPIPRSLNMALNGIREVSLLSKAPSVRKGVETFVSKFDDHVIQEAGNQEFKRGGQLFFIHNRVENIDVIGKYLEDLFPKKKIIITHGQLPGHELEERILAFKQKQFDILLSSTVIENGIDFPNVNTIIINDAYKFGISQIHQLRGRVGRGDKNGYCYLLFKKEKLSDDAAKRLTTIVEYSHLGAGFELAIRDLEIRGGGDVLGIKQSGLSSEVGINVYLKLLEDKIEELKNQSENISDTEERKKLDTTIDLNISAYIPDAFFDSELDKLNFYREIENISDTEDLENVLADFKEFSGDIPKESQNLFHLLKVKILANTYNIRSIKRNGVSYEINFQENNSVENLKKFLDIDIEVKFIVSSVSCVKCSCIKFEGDNDFLEYLYKIFHIKKEPIRKIIKLKK